MTPDDMEQLLAELFGTARRIAKTIRVQHLWSPCGAAMQALWSCANDLELAAMLSARMEVAVETVEAASLRALEPFFIGCERQFEGYTDPEEGAVGEVVEVSIYSATARPLLDLLGDIQSLKDGRARLEDAVRAWGEVNAALDGTK